MNRLLAMLFALVLVATLVALVPLRLALAWAGADREGLSAAGASGTVWSGRLHEAGFGGVRLGDLAVSLDPVALLTGKQRLNVRAEGGAVTGRAVLVGGSGGSGLAEATGSAPLALAPAGLAIRGAVTVQNLTAVFRAGRCVRAGGAVSTDLLQRNAVLTGDEGAPLTGQVSCRDGVLVAPLKGAARLAAVDLTLRIQGDGRYGLDTSITSADPAVASRLALAGFVLDGGARRRTDQGRLWR